jgi:membrane-bound serine protease (ClpP class)
MLFLAALLLAVFVLDAPWSWVVIVVGGAVDIGESLAFIWWSKRRRASVGAETLVGKTGVAIGLLWPEGQVRVEGEIWKARTAGGLDAGTRVVVRAVDGLTLEVDPDPSA